MQVIDRRKALSIPPIWRLAFRPFFLAGSVYALFAVPLWILAWSGVLSDWQPAGGWLAWHRHEMVFAFGTAIVAGFLLTAVQTWTGQPSLSGRPLVVLAVIWLAARLAWLLNLPLWLLIPLDLLFLIVLAGQMARLLWAVRQKRNYPIVVVLGLLTAADALTLAGLAMGQDAWQRQGSMGGLWLIGALMTLIGGRVIPFFTQRGLGRVQQVKAWPWLDGSLLIGTALIGVLHAFGWALAPQPLIGVLFLVLAAGHLLRQARWYDAGIWGVPLLWSLHLAMLWLVVACAGLGLWHLEVVQLSSPWLHAFTVGSMAGLILAMIARVTLGHTGRPLQPPVGMAAGFMLLNLGTVARVFLTQSWPLHGMWLAVACWALAFGIYAWQYAPMLCRARVDGHPG